MTFFVLFNETSSQSFGIIYEASSFNLQDLYFYEYGNPTGLIKNLFLNYNAPIHNSFILSFRAGYGWNKYEFSSDNGLDKETREQITDGIPIESQITYQHQLGKDSVFEPIFGIGIGYYFYVSKYNFGSSFISHKYISKGFAQYIIFGMNLNIANGITGSIQCKKIMANCISTKYEEGNSIFEKDYAQGNGFDDLSISIGLFFQVR